MLTVLRKALRRWVPMPPRLAVARLHRAVRDRLDGSHARIARKWAPQLDCLAVVTIEQPIKQSPMWEGKLVNLRQGVALLDGVKIAPGELFSFWHLIGQPTTARGFALGRSIRGDLMTADPGGGLCQLSGIVYELGLRSGLTVVERHAHSRDLYLTDEERFTPLGLDATVVWPWKDLRLENRLGETVVLRLAVKGRVLRAWMQADGEVALLALELEREDHAGFRRVTVCRAGELVSLDRYEI